MDEKQKTMKLWDTTPEEKNETAKLQDINLEPYLEEPSGEKSYTTSENHKLKLALEQQKRLPMFINPFAPLYQHLMPQIHNIQHFNSKNTDMYTDGTYEMHFGSTRVELLSARSYMGSRILSL
jgi:hypothetical protein